MKTIRLLALAATTFALAAALFAQPAPRPLYAWDFSRARANSGIVSVPESVEANDISFPSGASVVADAGAPGGRAVHFDGTLPEPGRSTRVITPVEAVRFSLRFKPDADSTAPLQTIVALNASYELRYDRVKEQIQFIVSYPDKKYVIVRADAAPGVWHQAVATFKDGKLTLSVGLSHREGVLPDGVSIAPKDTALRMAHMNDRPFRGSIAELVISPF